MICPLFVKESVHEDPTSLRLREAYHRVAPDRVIPRTGRFVCTPLWMPHQGLHTVVHPIHHESSWSFRYRVFLRPVQLIESEHDSIDPILPSFTCLSHKVHVRPFREREAPEDRLSLVHTLRASRMRVETSHASNELVDPKVGLSRKEPQTTCPVVRKLWDVHRSMRDSGSITGRNRH